MNDPTHIHWTDSLLVGFSEMDDVHREFVAFLSALQQAPDDCVAERLSALAAHARSHFGQEDSWMRQTEFPPRQCHMDEHAAVLVSIAQVEEEVVKGNLVEARRLADALEEWFPRHTTHLDSALSHWMSKRRWGAKPVVFRRKVDIFG